MSLPNILSASATLENTVLVPAGVINYAFNTPPETLLDLPVSVRFAEPTPKMDASRLLGRYNIFHFKIEVHLARGFLPESYANALPIIRAYQNLYAANLTVGGSCDICTFREPACDGPVRLSYGPGKSETVGIVFYMEAKEIWQDIVVDLAGAGITNFGAGLLGKTGQTTSYQAGDDGDLEKGLPQNYTVLTLGQYAGTTNIVLNAKTEVASNNCVRDNPRRLMWKRYVSASVGPTNNGLLPWTTNGAGEGIYTYVAAANAANLAGHNDWRVPNEKELQSIKNMEAPNALPDAVAFPGWPGSSIWTSTTAPQAAARAMYCAFGPGGVATTAKTTTLICALVRDA